VGLTDEQKLKIINRDLLVEDLSDYQLGEFCEYANSQYRAGYPVISDADYDFIYLKALKKRSPDHKIFKYIEPEIIAFSEEKVLIPESMLSIDKAYSFDEILKWIQRIFKSISEINFDNKKLIFKATPKLDGFAGYDDGIKLYTRGDGKKGSDITRVFERGLKVFNGSERGQGPGEIVVKKSYFDKYLATFFEFPRNFQASLIKEKELDEHAKNAIKNDGAFFVPFQQLPNWIGSVEELKSNFENIVKDSLISVDFDVDGVVFEVVNDEIKSHMGSNRKFHRWQIAFKENKDKAHVRVLSITPQVGRTGKITPVAELEPTQLSGATIIRATGHHYGLVRDQQLGKGSIIELTRSGLVIPKINKVLKPSEEVIIPSKCPSCGYELIWDSDFLICQNHKLCKSQNIGRIEHFFKVLANNDGFGVATIEKLFDKGVNQISKIYQLTFDELTSFGFGDKTSDNLLRQLDRSKTEEIEDWRFLAAFGVNRLGQGNCENLLRSHPLEEVFNLDKESIIEIDGFAEQTAGDIVQGLASIKDEFDYLYSLGFNLEKTKLKSELNNSNSLLLNKKIVFTGKMSSSRDEMKKYAKSIGIKVLSSVNQSTDYLVIGENVGPKKLQFAIDNNIAILKEDEYLKLIDESK
jgi:DNA ligase (NAD+)